MRYFVPKPLSKLTKHLAIMQEAMHHATIVETAKQRVFIAGVSISLAFLVIALRLADVMLIQGSKKAYNVVSTTEGVNTPRADIYDCNGNILATHLVTASIYATPKVVINADEAARKLATLFPDVGYKTFFNRLSSQRGFIWLTRHITPKMQQAVMELGIPGVYLQKDYKRVYPYGNLLAHTLGYCGLENTGLAGVEKYFDASLTNSKKPLKLSIDIRVQHIVRDVLVNAIREFKAVGGNAMVMDIKTGQMLAMVSAPDFDPHQINTTPMNATFNRNTLGVYEPGSTWKILNTAIALELGSATPKSMFDASAPIKIGRFTITDFKAKNRALSLTEAFVYSSNIASIKIAQQFGIHNQKAFFKKFGVFKPTKIEVPEIGSPLIPKEWRETTLMTASYGYGISVTPLQIMSIIGTIINNGEQVTPTLRINSDKDETPGLAGSKNRLISVKTSKTVREMMRMTSLHGGSRKAEIEGYEVFAKTGTAYQNTGKSGYNGRDRTTFCVGAFPFSDPKAVVIVMLDSPQATKETYNYATAGWNAAPTFGRIVERIAPMLGVHPRSEPSEMSYVKWYSDEAEIVQTKHQVDDQ